jgi:hypothetical protein
VILQPRRIVNDTSYPIPRRGPPRSRFSRRAPRVHESLTKIMYWILGVFVCFQARLALCVRSGALVISSRLSATSGSNVSVSFGLESVDAVPGDLTFRAFQFLYSREELHNMPIPGTRVGLPTRVPFLDVSWHRGADSAQPGYVINATVRTAPAETGSYAALSIEVSAAGREREEFHGALMYFTDNCPRIGEYGVRHDCKPCPTGAFCPGGARMQALEGYWVDYPDVFKCTPKIACMPGDEWGNECWFGFMGVRCAKCAPRFARNGDGFCEVYRTGRTVLPVMVLVIVVIPLLFLAFHAGRDGSFAAIPHTVFVVRLSQMISFFAVSPRGPHLQADTVGFSAISQVFTAFTGLPEYLANTGNIGAAPVQTILASIAFAGAIGIPLAAAVALSWRWPALWLCGGNRRTRATSTPAVIIAGAAAAAASADHEDAVDSLELHCSAQVRDAALAQPLPPLVLARRALVCVVLVQGLPILAVSTSGFACNSESFMLNYPEVACGSTEHILAAVIGLTASVTTIAILGRFVVFVSRRRVQLPAEGDDEAELYGPWAFAYGHCRPGRTRWWAADAGPFTLALVWWSFLSASAPFASPAFDAFPAFFTVAFVGLAAAVLRYRPYWGQLNVAYVCGQAALVFAVWTPRVTGLAVAVLIAWIAAVALAAREALLSLRRPTAIAYHDEYVAF